MNISVPFEPADRLLATCVVLFLVWQTVSSLPVVFAGVLFAAFLDAAARALGLAVPLNRTLRLVLVFLLVAIAGVVYTDASHQPLVRYWEFLALTIGTVCVINKWPEINGKETGWNKGGLHDALSPHLCSGLEQGGAIGPPF
jgi:hypothetical protein